MRKRKKVMGAAESTEHTDKKSKHLPRTIADLPPDILNYIFKLTNQFNLTKPTRIDEVCKFWNEQYNKSPIGKFQKIISQALKTLHNIQKSSGDAVPDLERIFINTGAWLTTCKENIIPKLEGLANENNLHAQLLLYKIYCENKLCQLDPSQKIKISEIEDYKISPKSAEANVIKGYAYLVRAAAQDKNAYSILLKLSALIVKNTQFAKLFEKDKRIMDLIISYSQKDQKNLATWSDNFSNDDSQEHLKMEV